MSQFTNARGDVICVIEPPVDCPSCGAARDDIVCSACGYATAEIDDKPKKVPPPKPQRPRADDLKYKPHVDVQGDTACVVCAGDLEFIGGILQCPVCGPKPGTVIPPDQPRSQPKPEKPNGLPADKSCPACVKQAMQATAERSAVPVDIGERDVIIDFELGGRAFLVCPVCGDSEEIGATPTLARADGSDNGIKAPDATAVPSVTGPPPLEVRRRKKG